MKMVKTAEERDLWDWAISSKARCLMHEHDGERYVILYICDQICERGLIHASNFTTLKRHNVIYK